MKLPKPKLQYKLNIETQKKILIGNGIHRMINSAAQFPQIP